MTAFEERSAARVYSSRELGWFDLGIFSIIHSFYQGWGQPKTSGKLCSKTTFYPKLF
jgi:hypothetical protein